MRFKCVSKSWQSFIQGSYFVELHLSRSKTHPQLLITVQNLNCDSLSIFSPEDEFIGGVALQKATVAWSEHAAMLTPIDGLCCFVDYLYGVTCICNLGTRQFTPGAQTSVNLGTPWAQFQTSANRGTRQGEPFEEPPPLVTQKPTYGFGFDPMTKKYKILCVWEICNHALEAKYFLGLGTMRPKLEQICEVFTVGENQWRKIDEAPGIRLSGAAVYAKGSIYMRNDGVDLFTPPDNEVVVAFDVGSEKFRVIQIPDFIVGSSGTVKRDSDRRARNLLQIDGHMALMDRVDEYVMKLWISDDSYKEKKMTTNWTEETIWLPSPFQEGHYPRLIPVQGTDEIIIASQIPAHIDPSPRRFVSVYIYNRTMKSSQEIDIAGVSALLTSPYPYGMFIYHESLVPIQDAEKKLDRPT
ncbi:hypothetical protein MKW98_025125 [Papaver atlanticum]|uniref:F-box associated beta-propeller type 3 domain-containing protein n=1 Tax=Papaver atlanticum TaxID=357466 RepID=A0AAD4S327_9MAGN|nr:hypothetical protein MKW98_025125 [Papaver atlanticum]